MYKGKEVRVKLSEEADKVYEELNKIVGEEKLKKVDSSFHQTLLRLQKCSLNSLLLIRRKRRHF